MSIENLKGWVVERLTTSQIADALYNDDNAGWSREGAYALADYMENLAEELDEPIELDIVAWRCDFTEQSIETIAQDYDVEVENVIEWLEEEGALVAELDNGKVVYNYSML